MSTLKVAVIMFKTFPEFSKLTLASRKEYEELIKNYLPVGDIHFGNLMVWWDALGSVSVSRLHNNLVISYWIPGDERHSGLALIGTQNVDESICTIFDYSRSRGEEPKLVNVPEFVVNSLQYPELFSFKSGRGDDEYLISPHKFAQVEKLPLTMRGHIKKFMKEIKYAHVDVHALDLGLASDRQLLLSAVKGWPRKGINNINKLEQEVFPLSIDMAPSLGLQAVGLFVDDDLVGFCTYFLDHGSKYMNLGHARVDYSIPGAFDYMVHAFCKYFQEQGVEFINLHSDNGSLKMRTIKIALRPEHFFRKYTIEPEAVHV